MDNTKSDKTASKKINFRDLIDYEKCLDRMKNYYGVSTDKDLQEILGVKQSAFSMGKKPERGFPFEIIATFCMKEKKSFDWALFGEQKNVLTFTGSPKITISRGNANQTSGIIQAPGSNFAQRSDYYGSSSTEEKLNPEMKRIIKLLEYYGSPALFDKIETVIGQMYGIEPPIKLPNDK